MQLLSFLGIQTYAFFYSLARDSQDGLGIECLYGEFLAKVLILGAPRPAVHWVKVSSLGRCPDFGGPD